jgi:hypothetical protein
MGRYSDAVATAWVPLLQVHTAGKTQGTGSTCPPTKSGAGGTNNCAHLYTIERDRERNSVGFYFLQCDSPKAKRQSVYKSLCEFQPPCRDLSPVNSLLVSISYYSPPSRRGNPTHTDHLRLSHTYGPPVDFRSIWTTCGRMNRLQVATSDACLNHGCILDSWTVDLPADPQLLPAPHVCIMFAW